MSGYTDVAQARCTNLFKQLTKKYPKQLEMITEYGKLNHYQFDAKGERVPIPLEPQITAVEYTKYGRSAYGIRFDVRITKTGPSLIGFTLDLYPECCALHQLNAFHHDSQYVDPDFAEAFIEECIRIYRYVVTTTQRIMINFVEATRYDHFSTSDVIPVDEKSTINYPLFYKWANKYQTNETLFVNHNTGRIIHNVVVNYANGVKK